MHQFAHAILKYICSPYISGSDFTIYFCLMGEVIFFGLVGTLNAFSSEEKASLFTIASCWSGGGGRASCFFIQG